MSTRRKTNSIRPSETRRYRVQRASDGVIIVRNLSKLKAEEVAADLAAHSETHSKYVIKLDNSPVVNLTDYLRP